MAATTGAVGKAPWERHIYSCDWPSTSFQAPEEGHVLRAALSAGRKHAAPTELEDGLVGKRVCYKDMSLLPELGRQEEIATPTAIRIAWRPQRKNSQRPEPWQRRGLWREGVNDRQGESFEMGLLTTDPSQAPFITERVYLRAIEIQTRSKK